MLAHHKKIDPNIWTSSGQQLFFGRGGISPRNNCTRSENISNTVEVRMDSYGYNQTTENAKCNLKYIYKRKCVVWYFKCRTSWGTDLRPVKQSSMEKENRSHTAYYTRSQTDKPKTFVFVFCIFICISASDICICILHWYFIFISYGLLAQEP